MTEPIDFSNPLERHLTTEQKTVMLLKEIRDILARAFPVVQSAAERVEELEERKALIKNQPKGRR